MKHLEIAIKINEAIKNRTQTKTIVYDNSVSPPTYGDIVSVLLLARYHIANNINVRFLIIDSEFRADWFSLGDKSKIKQFVTEQEILSRTLLNPMFSTVEKISWKDFVATDKADLLLDQYVMSRRGTYLDSLNIINHLLKKCNKQILNKTIFSKSNLFFNTIANPIKNKYISMACRFSDKWEPNRNTTENDFISSYVRLTNKFPNHHILVVSDLNGCGKVKLIQEKFGLNLLYSKDYSNSFVGDVKLVLDSDFYFQYQGGGMAMFPLFSLMPYDIFSPLANKNVMWSEQKFTSFQTRAQKFRVIS